MFYRDLKGGVKCSKISVGLSKSQYADFYVGKPNDYKINMKAILLLL